MPEPTKDQITAENERLTAENERLKGELASARAGAASPAQVTLADVPYVLTEGDRQAMELNGVTNNPLNGEQLLASDFKIEVKTEAGKANLKRAQEEAKTKPRAGIRGVDFVAPATAGAVRAPQV